MFFSFYFLLEIVSFLYAILMNAGSAQSSSPTLPESTINLVTEALCMLNFMGTVDLKVLQVSTADENFTSSHALGLLNIYTLFDGLTYNTREYFASCVASG